MKPISILLVILGVFCLSLQAQVLRPFTLRYSNPSVRGNIVFVANNIITSTGNTSEAPPGGTSSNSGPGVNINVANNLISTGSTWKYLDNNTRPAGWESSGYNDAAWASGPSQLGFGDGDEATTINGGPGSNRYVTTYFRKAITIANPALFTSFSMNVTYDDGFVVYVNGVEVNRTGMPTGTVTHGTYANVTSENAVASLTIPSSAFSPGTNVIAVEVHQVNAASSDISFDMTLSGADAIYNSSSADLNLSGCSQVMWAGLYWGAGQGGSGSDVSWITGENNVKLKLPGAGSFINITSSQTDYHNNTLIPGYAHTGFKSFADITSLINASSANGTYTVGNVVSPAGYSDAYGGWTIVIAYTNSTLPIRNLSVYDGNAGVKSGSGNVDVSISGFLTPPSGPVSCELGAVAYDGDRGSTDAFYFKQASSPTFFNLTPNATSNLDDMWNSTISYKGSVVTTRNPAHQNTLGYDADIIDLPNSSNAQLGNNETAATVRFSSPNENYIVQVLTTSISQFNPSVKFVKSSTDLNGGTLVGGDILRYRLNYRNVGADDAINSVITDNIPAGSSYKPGSLKINGVAKTDASSDDEAEFSVVNNSITLRVGSGATASGGGRVTATNSVTDSGYVEFDVYVTSSCVLTGCTNTLSNSARIDYTGNTSLSNLYDSSGTINAGCFFLGPLTNTIAGTCFVPRDTIMLNSCPTTTVTLPAALYAGYRFYSGMPFNSGNSYNPLTPVASTRIIYAYGTSGTCRDTIKININVSSCPDIDKDRDGIPDYVESNNPAALPDADGDGIPNYRDTDYPGFTDHNNDGINDNFDPGADSDNDGIPNFLDNSFPGFTDANGDGVNDHMDSDQDGVPDFLDIDSDNDGIPDNIEAQTTGSFTFPSGMDSDGDGLDNAYDTYTGVGGRGIAVVDTDADTVPDYLDSDSDADGVNDIVEGNDINLNGLQDDNIVLTGSDSDGDGLDDVFDNDNASHKGTSAYMGTNGSNSGDINPGSITTVQRTLSGGCPSERDWRCTQFVLNCAGLQLHGEFISKSVMLHWTNPCHLEVYHFNLQRSFDGKNFSRIAQVSRQQSEGAAERYDYLDNAQQNENGQVFYRIDALTTSGNSIIGPVITLRNAHAPGVEIKLSPNPVKHAYTVSVSSVSTGLVELKLLGPIGNVLFSANEKMRMGQNKFTYSIPEETPNGMYYLQVRINDLVKTIKLYYNRQ